MKSYTNKLLSFLFCLTLTIAVFLPLNVALAEPEPETKRFYDGMFEDPYSNKVVIGATYNEETYIMGKPYIVNNVVMGREAVKVTLNSKREFDLPANDEKILTMTKGEYMSVSGAIFTPLYFQAQDGYIYDDDVYENMPVYGTHKLTVTNKLADATYFTTSWNDSWTLSYSYWKRDIIHITKNDQYNDRISLKVADNDGTPITPYFTITWYTNATHISSSIYSEVCAHKNMQYVEGTPASCSTDGTHGYYICPECPDKKFADINGDEYMRSAVIPAYSAIDVNNDGVCDDCGKNMPIYEKVTASSEIMAGGKYLLVSQMEDKYYVMKSLSEADAGNYGTDKIAAAEVTLTGEKIKFTDAKLSGAMMATLKFSTISTNWENGGMRFGMHYSDNNFGYGLTCYSGNLHPQSAEIAKYGNHIVLDNSDSTVCIASAYDEYWYPESPKKGDSKGKEPTTGNPDTLIYFRAFAVTQDGETERFFSMKPKANFENGIDEVTEYPVYLYRLVENGTVTCVGTEVSYIISDEQTAADYTQATAVTENIAVEATTATTVSGVAQAMSQDAINSYVSLITPTGDIRLSTKVNVSVAEYVSSGTGNIGGLIVFDLAPVIYDVNSPNNVFPVSDSSFNGQPMTVILYTGGIVPTQIIHEKQDGTKEYFYNEYSEEAQNGEKTFSLGTDENGNMYAEFTVTEFSTIKLLEAPEVDNYAISNFDAKSGTVNIACKEAGSYTVAFADYEENALNNANVITLSLKSGVNTVSISKNILLSTGDKVFLWNSFESVKPLCEAYIVE